MIGIISSFHQIFISQKQAYFLPTTKLGGCRIAAFLPTRVGINPHCRIWQRFCCEECRIQDSFDNESISKNFDNPRLAKRHCPETELKKKGKFFALRTCFDFVL
jgi:hypothetical protein